MKDPEASWKGICSTSMKGPEPRPRKGWEEPEKSGRGQEAERAKKRLGKGVEAWRRPRRVCEERLGRPQKGPEEAPKRPRDPEKAGKAEATKGP